MLVRRKFAYGVTILLIAAALRLSQMRAFEALANQPIDIALLPINGYLPERKVAGNLWGREAAWLAGQESGRQPYDTSALLRAGNPSAAIAQIKVAPGVRELKALEKALAAAGLAGKWRDVDVAITESLQALSAPRLHRSP